MKNIINKVPCRFMWNREQYIDRREARGGWHWEGVENIGTGTNKSSSRRRRRCRRRHHQQLQRRHSCRIRIYINIFIKSTPQTTFLARNHHFMYITLCCQHTRSFSWIGSVPKNCARTTIHIYANAGFRRVGFEVAGYGWYVFIMLLVWGSHRDAQMCAILCV